MKINNKGGFTLLEIIIVLIIVGVLASMALPRLFATVEFSRSAEALSSFATIRGSMERCHLMRNGTYVGCDMPVLDITDPGTSPNAHFAYSISGQSADGYTITATRNALRGGTAGDTITLTQTATDITRAGTGRFVAIQ